MVARRCTAPCPQRPPDCRAWNAGAPCRVPSPGRTLGRVQPRMFSKCAHIPEAHRPATATAMMINAIVIAMRKAYSIRELPALSRHGRQNLPIIVPPHTARRLARRAMADRRDWRHTCKLLCKVVKVRDDYPTGCRHGPGIDCSTRPMHPIPSRNALRCADCRHSTPKPALCSRCAFRQKAHFAASRQSPHRNRTVTKE
jgi:hypothetical protein